MKIDSSEGVHLSAGVILLNAILVLSTTARDGQVSATTEPVTDARQNQASELLLEEDAEFSRLQEKYRIDAGFRAYEARLTAATFLTDQMCRQLRKATAAQFSKAADEVFDGADIDAPVPALSVAPARQFYDTSLKVFSRPVNIASLAAPERSFLAQYYNLKLKSLTSRIAEAGQALAIARPAFKGTYDYTLVLPLLHASEDRPVNVDVLPSWMQTPEQLDACSESCLLTFEMPFFAMAMAREAAQRRDEPFSAVEFYRLASGGCGEQYPHVAVDCLARAMKLVPEADADLRVILHLEVIQLWLDSQNYQLAASEARKTFEAHPSHDRSGQIIWLYYYALSRSNNTQQILADIDNVLDDERCAPYRVKLMYIKWWALRRQRDQGARVTALEHEMLKRYGKDPIVAPILLSQATDLLASQSYDQASSVLRQLAEKFPTTRAAVQAKRMLDKLGTVQKGM